MMQVIQEENKIKTIAVKQDTYDRLKELGFTGDSFNDVIERLIEKVENY
ncbi:MAG TPA: antitoxin VapB family protein [Nitrososphaeraceae archaeon]|nr:antitoxin VapB family protein [Nitrososphaeraceae archaeon]